MVKINRYLRNKNTISDYEQEILAKTKILVIGAGGLGSHVLEGLVRMGINHLGICDYDIIEESNLNRQLLALEKTISLAKSDLAVARLKEINSQVTIKTYEKYPCLSLTRDFSEYDLVIDCLDSIQTRKQLEIECLENNKKMIYGTIAGNYGFFGVVDQENQLLKHQIIENDSIEKELGNPYYIVACLASMQLVLAKKILLNQKYLKKGFYALDLESMNIDQIIID